MLNSDILEVSVGIVFVFVLISTLCAAIREGLEAWLKTRASYLEFAIRELLYDKTGTGLAKQLFNHPLIYSLFPGDYTPGKPGVQPGVWQGGRNLPSYIPSRNFALAIMDIAAKGPPGVDKATAGSGPGLSLATIRSNLASLGNSNVERALLTAIDTAQGDLNRVQANIEAWYNSSMERVSGWYKRSTQWVLFGIGLVMAVGLNVNTVTIADYLYRHDAVRSAVVGTIEKTAADPAGQTSNYLKARKELYDMHLPMGWSKGWGAPLTRSERADEVAFEPPRKGSTGEVSIAEVSAWNDVFGPLVGWLITAFAATLGAPFWFDILNRIMVIRSTVKPDEKSEDRRSDVRPPPSAQNTLAVISTEEVGGANDDCCGIGNVAPTPDERLPAAQGGVARYDILARMVTGCAAARRPEGSLG